VAHFSVKKPAHFWVKINNVGVLHEVVVDLGLGRSATLKTGQGTMSTFSHD